MRGCAGDGCASARLRRLRRLLTVREEASERAGDDVHEAEDRGEGARRHLRQCKVLVEELRGDVGDGELDAEAEAVSESEDPRVDVGEADLGDDVGF